VENTNSAANNILAIKLGLKTGDIVNIQGGFYILIKEAKEPLVLEIESKKSIIPLNGTMEQLRQATVEKGGHGLGLVDLLRKDSERIFIGGKNVDEPEYVLTIRSAGQINIGINAPNNTDILREEVFNAQQKQKKLREIREKTDKRDIYYFKEIPGGYHLTDRCGYFYLCETKNWKCSPKFIGTYTKTTFGYIIQDRNKHTCICLSDMTSSPWFDGNWTVNGNGEIMYWDQDCEEKLFTKITSIC
jgi:sRNA-binding carbon storage regulator CsrA